MYGRQSRILFNYFIYTLMKKNQKRSLHLLGVPYRFNVRCTVNVFLILYFKNGIFLDGDFRTLVSCHPHNL